MAVVVYVSGKRIRPGVCDVCGDNDDWYVRDPDTAAFVVVCGCMDLDKCSCAGKEHCLPPHDTTCLRARAVID